MVAGQLLHRVGGEHLGLAAKGVLKAAVVHLGVPRRDDEEGALPPDKGQGLGDPRRKDVYKRQTPAFTEGP